MFAPPPAPSLTKAEIAARRTQAAQDAAEKILSSTPPEPSLEPWTNRQAISDQARPSPAALMRKIGKLSAVKEKIRKPTFVISNPLPTPPPKTQLPLPPLIPPSKYPPPQLPTPPVPSSHGTPPRRPPRPEANLRSTNSTTQSESVSEHLQRSSLAGYKSLPRPRDRKVSGAASFGSKSSSSRSISDRSYRSTTSRVSSDSGSSQTLERNASGSSRQVLWPPALTINKDTPKSKGRKASKSMMEKDDAEAMSIGRSVIDRAPFSISVGNQRHTDKALPSPPDSIVETPAEMYAKGDHFLRERISARRAAHKSSKISLSQVDEIKTTSTAVRQSTHSISGSTTPAATQIRLKNGSTVIVAPPEASAWTRRCYIPGPIRLNKAAAQPRKNSLASLEAFQDAIDQVVKDNASLSSRRRGDDAAIEEICEFFLSFGFDNIRYDGDAFEAHPGTISEESEEEASMLGIPLFDSPPSSPRPMMQLPNLPPVKTEEALRARGIARLAKARVRLSNEGTVDQDPPVPEQSRAKAALHEDPTAKRDVPVTQTSKHGGDAIWKQDIGQQHEPAIAWASPFKKENVVKLATQPKRFSL